MAESLQFVLELVDRMSSTAEKMASALEKVQKRTHEAGKESEDFFSRVEAANKRVKESFLEGLAEKFAVFELAKSGIELLGELGEKFVEATFEAGLFEQRSRIAFTGLTGDARIAGDVIAEVKGFANQFGESYDKIGRLFQKGLLGGLKATEGPLSVQKVAQFGLDVEKMGGPQAEAILQTFTQMHQQGQVMGRQAAMTFEQMGIPLDKLASRLGLAHVNLKELRSTTFDADKVLRAALDTFHDLHGTIGTTSEAMGKTFPGRIQVLKNHWDDLLGKFAESKALDRVEEIVGNIAKAFDPATASGHVFAELLDKLFSKLERFLAPLATEQGMTKFADTVTKIAHGIETMVGWIERAVPWVERLFGFMDKGLEYQKLISGVGPIQSLIGKAADFFGSPETRGPEAAGFGATKGGLHAFAEGGHVDGPTWALVGEGGEGEWMIPDSKMGALGGRTVHAPIHQEIHVHPEASLKGAETGEAIHRIGLGELQGALDTLAMSMGG